MVVAAFDFPEGDFPIVMTHVTGPTSFHFRAAASDRSYTSMMNGMKVIVTPATLQVLLVDGFDWCCGC